MNYKNGKDVLPSRLLKELQDYIQGELVYIPKKEKIRAGWGELNGTKLDMQKRNNNIYCLYKNGASIADLACQYHLSEDSIRKIISKSQKSIEKDHMLVLLK